MSEYATLEKIVRPKDMAKIRAFLSVLEQERFLQDTSMVVDACSGNGLLGRYLADAYGVAVIALDQRRSERYDRVRSVFPGHIPHLFLRQSIYEPLPAYTVVSIHACGHLTDILIDHASKQGTAIAVMPCCYDKRRILWEHADITYRGDRQMYINTLRAKHLETTQDVVIRTIDHRITAENQIIIGIPRKISDTQ